MATVNIVFGRWNERWPLLGVVHQSEAITSSGTAQNSSNTGTTKDNCVEITTSGGDIWITLDGTTAAEGDHFLVLNGSTRHVPAGLGTVISVIDA
jgi:hypothetical protein